MPVAPLFTSAPRVAMYFGTQRIAYAVGININVSVNVQPIQIMGEFGLISTEPTFYNVVTGTLQIIRLIKADTRSDTITASNTFEGTNSDAANATTATLADSNIIEDNIANQAALRLHMDPSKVLASSTFDLDLHLRVPAQNDDTLDPNTPSVNAATLQTNSPYKKWMRIIDCRLSSRSLNISVGQLVNEPVNFQGLLATPVTETGTGDNVSLVDAFDLDNFNTSTT